MEYVYTRENGLTSRQTYMYSAFGGYAFLSAYIDDRLASIRAFEAISFSKLPASQIFEQVFSALVKRTNTEDVSLANDFSSIFTAINPPNTAYSYQSRHFDSEASERELNSEKPIDTSRFFERLLDKELSSHGQPPTTSFDRLLQRFEVTKKIYEKYEVGLGKGVGGSDNLYLYWLFSASLCFYFLKEGNLKYLNALLKVNDILCSVSSTDLSTAIPSIALKAVVSFEAVSVNSLALKKGVNLDH